MFLFKKFITAFLLPPGLFILLCIIAFFLVKKRTKILCASFALLIYFFSIEPTKNLFLKPLESAHPFPSIESIKNCEAYIVLGGGLREGVPELSGVGELSHEAYQRTVTAFRVYKIKKRPIILTGGSIFKREAESHYARKLLLSLGVKEEHIFLEDKSRDTYENAKSAKEIAEREKIKRVLLITNAYHAKRANLIFSRYFDVIVLPIGYKTSKRPYDILSFLPDATNTESISCALKEYLGIIHFKTFFKD
ncbi:MAG: YdcF family protein [Deltaproteobacteria bacterium]|nr:YdcF family protein [Deltaproteobacteria bacterium]